MLHIHRIELTATAHSSKNRLTQFRAVDLRNGEQIFIRDLGCQTVNIGEFLGIIETGYEPKIIYSDSLTATIWINNKKIASKKYFPELLKAEVYLRIFDTQIKQIEIIHWDKI